MKHKHIFYDKRPPTPIATILKSGAQFLPRRLLASEFSLKQWTVNLIELHWAISRYHYPLFRHGLQTETHSPAGVKCEWLYKSPHNKNDIVFFLHSGAYLYGDLPSARNRGIRYAQNTNASVFIVDYRVSAAAPFPAALEDALTAYVYLRNANPLANITFLGDSAGGGLCLSLVHKLKSLSFPLPQKIILNSPWTDLTCSSKTCWCKQPVDTVLYVPLLRQAADLYAAGENLKNPLLSPLFGDFSGFPPTWIQVGTDEVLLDDSVHLANRMNKQGVNVHLHVWEGMFHMFHYWESLCTESQEVCRENYRLINTPLSK